MSPLFYGACSGVIVGDVMLVVTDLAAPLWVLVLIISTFGILGGIVVNTFAHHWDADTDPEGET